MLTTLTKLSSTAFLLLAGDPFTSTQKFANDTIPKIQLIEQRFLHSFLQ